MKSVIKLGKSLFNSPLARTNLVRRAKHILLGQHTNDGLIAKLLLFSILAATSILYLNPLLYMLITSVQTLSDLLDPAINWIPTSFIFDNYKTAYEALRYPEAFRDTILLAGGASVVSVLACAITGYAFARLHIPGKKIWLALVIITFLIPQEILVIPLIMWYAKLGWYNTIMPFIIPAIFAQGLKAPLFILIYRQFFSRLPHELEESARMDGAGPIRTFATIMLPLAKPSMLVVFILSFVWHWNDFFHVSMFIKGDQYMAMSVQMDMLQNRLNLLAGDVSGRGGNAFVDINEPLKMAASTLMIMPPLILYMFLQRYFTQGLDRSGLVE